ncbi:hypothetical protein [Wohlfahrtiimonas chitiniclastica]|uniref:hypothetical protein n=1 Tax=Wohlfahrtiimonas chitiniclastica TaxID=400946 RepID=UPI0007B696FD|nr:hypothetical protein [Wohlfahrtiimonas chitiniclastica]KZX37740.1 hypothetical protein A6V30_02365 [Wohlfahrtiimonas chitiniclastica]
MQAQHFSDKSHQRIALMGMSGVGKTTLSNLLPKTEWFHYSIDYRIGTRYLHEEISDLLKIEAMKSPALAKLLRSDSAFIAPNITLDNLNAISMFISMVGALDKGGLPLDEFLARLDAHRTAEINAMMDTQAFIDRATHIYGYPHFICDFSGSVCELDAPDVIDAVAKECLLIYIKATDNMMSTLIDRAQKYPKPLYYQADFLHTAIKEYCTEQSLNGWQEIDPNHFAVWVFPHLVKHRLVRYDAIAAQHGITLSAEETLNIHSAEAFLDLIDRTLRTQG